jgi:hypothetical protein
MRKALAAVGILSRAVSASVAEKPSHPAELALVRR